MSKNELSAEQRERARRVFEALVDLSAEEAQPKLDAMERIDPAVRAEVKLLLRLRHQAKAAFTEPPTLAEIKIASPISPPAGALGCEDSAPRPGDRVGQFLIKAVLGRGGFGFIYEAEQSKPLHRTVALKILRPRLATPSACQRFLQEGSVMARINHPGVAKVFDAGLTEGGLPFLAMECIEGGVPITQYADEHKLPIHTRLRLFMQVCDAVQAAHQFGVIHRDLKPSNVLAVDHAGMPGVKVIDFGVAKLTQPLSGEDTPVTQCWELFGTPEYMSPEHFDGPSAHVDIRTDVYSLGVLLCELLAGARPYEMRGLELSECRRVVQECDPPRVSELLGAMTPEEARQVAAHRSSRPRELRELLRWELELIPAKALRRDLDERYRTVQSLMDDIARYLSNETLRAARSTAPYRIRKFVRRNRSVVALLALVLCSLLVALGVVDGQRRRTRTAEQISRSVLDFVNAASVADPFFGAAGSDPTVADMLASFDRQISPELHPLAEAHLRSMMGNTYLGMSRLDDAERHLSRATELFESSAGEDDVLTIESLGDLARLYHYADNQAEAKQRVTDALLRIERAGLPETGQMSRRLRLVLASILRSTEQYDEAEALYRKTIEGGGESPASRRITIDAVSDLGGMYATRKRFDEAAPLLLQALADSRIVLGEAHPSTLTTQSNLASFYTETGQLDKALPLHLRTVESLRRVPGERNFLTLAAISNLGGAYLSMGMLEEAERELSAAYPVQVELFGEDAYATLMTAYLLGDLDRASGRYRQGQERIAECIRRAGKMLSPDALELATFRHTLGACHQQLGEHVEAEAALLESYRAMAAVLGPDASESRKIAASLAELYEAWERPAEHADWQGRSTPKP